MRLPLSVTLLLIGAILATAAYNQRRIADLRRAHQELADQARADGWVYDPSSPDSPDNPIHPPRPRRTDPQHHARQVTDAILTYARDLPFPDEIPPHEVKQRIALESERLRSLDGPQLLTLIAELRASPDLDPSARHAILAFALHQLSQTHPRDAFLIAIESAKDHRPLLESATAFMKSWASEEPAAARAWLDESSGTLRPPDRAALQDKLLLGTFGTEPLLALDWYDQLKPPGPLYKFIDRLELTPFQRLQLLQALRTSPAMKDGVTITPFERGAILRALLFDPHHSLPPPADGEPSLWAEARPSSDEIRDLAAFDVSLPNHGAKWFEWIGRHIPEKDATPWQAALLRNPKLTRDIHTWLATQDPGLRDRWFAEPPPAPPSPQNSGAHPVASPVPGKPGFVFSPFTNRIIDVKGILAGSAVMDPETNRIFRLP
jgi:hypothetical protein